MKQHMTKEEAREKASKYFERANIYMKPEEIANMEIADLGLGRLEEFGIELYIYVNTKRCAAKEMVLFPGQICPEQIHPPFGDYPGKEETFRVRMGTLYLYTEGEPTSEIKAHIPEDKKNNFHVFHEIILEKGDQYTLEPNIAHWICGGPEGCVISEFSSYNRDDYDIYTDPEVVRMNGVKPFED